MKGTAKTGDSASPLPRIILIAAMAANRVIGRDNTIPWHLPGDLARFRTTTMGHPLIMGRRTFESIGRPLPGRSNIVLSRDRDLILPGCLVVHSLDQALEACRGRDRAFIIGGEQLYRDALPLADEIILTVLEREVEGDTFFPELPEQAFSLVHAEPVEGPVPGTIRTFRRNW